MGASKSLGDRSGNNLEIGDIAATGDTMRTTYALTRLADAGSRALSEVGSIDHVTMLPNRKRFVVDLETGLGAPASAGNERLIVLMTLADARHFNDILRALGHAYSEDFVREGASRLCSLLPHETTVYHVSVLSFAFIIDHRGGECPDLINEMVRAFRPPLYCHDIPIDSHVGIGITRLSPDGDAAELLRATLAAAQDSRLKPEGWAWYDKKSDDAHVRAFKLLTDLKPAIEAGDQLYLEFQPRIGLATRRCLSAEALIRWRHPELGLVAPMEFIPLAEATALITPLTRAVVEMATAQLAEWRRAGIAVDVSVNISPKNVMESDFVDFVLSRCADCRLDPSALELEFTEGTLSANNRTAMQRLAALHAQGVEIAIDDFGSGYSNMSYLTSLPAQVIKIDQSFVRPLDTRPKNEILLRSIINLGHDLGYKIVAEGIETEPSFDNLRDWGCDEGQGYFMSRPLAEPALRDWLRDWH